MRREVEKSQLVRQLKAQINALRTGLTEKDTMIENINKKISATHLLELTAEKEEYFVEVDD